MKTLLIYLIPLLICACNSKSDFKPQGFFPIKEFGKWGYINNEGKTVIKCQFDGAGTFTEGLAPILIDTLYGFIDTTGKIIITPQFFSVSVFSDGLCFVTIQKDTTFQNAFIRKDGSISFLTLLEDVGLFFNGRAVAKINDEICFIDTTGNIVFNTHYRNSTNRFRNGIAHVWGSPGEWFTFGTSRILMVNLSRYYDTSGKLIASMDGIGFDDFSEGLVSVIKNDIPMYIDTTGTPVILNLSDKYNYGNFSDGLARVNSTGSTNEFKSGFIDTTGKIVIEIKFDWVRDFKEGLAPFQEKDQWGFINKKGRIAIDPTFEEVAYLGFTNGLCWVKQNHQWGYINYEGEFVWKEQVGFEYEKLDLGKWVLDTLELNHPLNIDRYAGGDNFPRKQSIVSLGKLTLTVDTTDLTVFADKYLAFKLYLMNSSKDTIRIPAQSGRIKIIQQAKNIKGDWQDIENFYNDFCGNSYHTIKLLPNEFQIFATPIFKGEFITSLRFKLILEKQEIYSNAFNGQINFGQLLNPEDRDETGIVVWTN